MAPFRGTLHEVEVVFLVILALLLPLFPRLVAFAYFTHLFPGFAHLLFIRFQLEDDVFEAPPFLYDSVCGLHGVVLFNRLDGTVNDFANEILITGILLFAVEHFTQPIQGEDELVGADGYVCVVRVGCRFSTHLLIAGE